MLTDVGNPEACHNILDDNGKRIALYTNVEQGVSHLRGIARIGVCVPIECNQESMDYFNDKYFGYMNAQLLLLPSYGINFNTLIFNNQS